MTAETSTRLGGYTDANAYDGVTSGTSAGPGNLTSLRGVGQSIGTSGDNQLSGSGYVYDGEGNPTAYQGATLSYDPEDRLTGLSPASAPAPKVAQPGFETPSEGTGGSAYAYDPSGSAWSFTGGAGLAGNGSSFTFGNPSAPEGTQVAFLQNDGSISQSLSGWQEGTQYTVTVSAAQRANYGTGAGGVSQQTFQVKLDGQIVGVITPSSRPATYYADYTVGPFTTTAGTHTLSFEGYDPAGGDNTALLDNVRLSATTAAPSFGYRADGLRAWKMVGTGDSAVKTYYLYDGGSLVCELSGQSGTAGAVTASYTWGPNGLLSSHQYAGSGTSYFYVFDPSGNPAQRLAGSGTLGVSPYAFDGFGAREGAGTSDPASGFSSQFGGYTDAETGLVLMGHRYYDPGTGRFLTRDPIGYAGGLNLYAYTQNNPVSRIDPSGLFPDLPDVPTEYDDNDPYPYYGAHLCWVRDNYTRNYRNFERNFTKDEKALNTEFGKEYGCWRCGTKDPGTKSGNFICDEQPSRALGGDEGPIAVLPHCKPCSDSQGGHVSAGTPLPPVPPTEPTGGGMTGGGSGGEDGVSSGGLAGAAPVGAGGQAESGGCYDGGACQEE